MKSKKDNSLKLLLPKWEKHLALLEEALIKKKSRVVEIHGAIGTGKTFLATIFGSTFQKYFPGGMSHIAMHPWLTSEFPKIALRIPNPRLPHLVVLDDLDAMSREAATEKLDSLLDEYKRASFILTGNNHFFSELIELSIDLGGPTSLTVANCLRNFGVVLPAADLAKLTDAVQNNSRALEIVARLLRDGKYTLSELLKSLKPLSAGGIVDIAGRRISSGRNYLSIISDVAEVSDELLSRITRNPSLIHELSPRRFEEVTAEILARHGYEVRLTPVSKDGGKDIYVATKSTFGSFMYLVECKKYAPENHVGIELVQRLHGVVQAERATAGILVTTSTFSGPAKQFQSMIPYQLSLVDYIGIQRWLREIPKR